MEKIKEQIKVQKAEANAVKAILDTEGFKIIMRDLTIDADRMMGKLLDESDPLLSAQLKAEIKAIRSLFGKVKKHASIDT